GVVGLKEDINTLPKSYFVGDGDIYIFRWKKTLVTSGYAQQVFNSDLGGYTGKISLKAWAQGAKDLRELVLAVKPTATRVVGKFGLAYALARMTQQGIGAEIDFKNEKSLSDLFIENFYEVLLEVPKGTDISKSPISEYVEMECIGSTGGDRLNLRGFESLMVKDLSETYQLGWRQNFESLA
ncbi:MAG: hypothetical protein KDD34_08630, partial [Bdellovibrionales bacterium]|nr:hypothetical protein [Bdellovibrionales bacterium]